jgi:hypothetical protein
VKIDLDDEFCAQEGTNGTLEQYREVLKKLEATNDPDVVAEAVEGCVDRIIVELANILGVVGSDGDL